MRRHPTPGARGPPVLHETPPAAWWWSQHRRHRDWSCAWMGQCSCHEGWRRPCRRAVLHRPPASPGKALASAIRAGCNQTMGSSPLSEKAISACSGVTLLAPFSLAASTPRLAALAQFFQREGCQSSRGGFCPSHSSMEASRWPRPARKGPRSAVVQPWIGRPVNGVIGSVIVVQSLVCPWPVSAACLRSLSAARHLPERDAGQRQTPLRRVE